MDVGRIVREAAILRRRGERRKTSPAAREPPMTGAPYDPAAAVRDVLVINPNSSRSMTAAMGAALHSWDGRGTVTFECLTLDDGPAVVSTAADIVHAAEATVRAVSQRRASAYVIACFSDPGLETAREHVGTRAEVFGIGESAIADACALADRFGLISTTAASSRRHEHWLRRLGLEHRLAADLATDLGVLACGGAEGLARSIELGRQLRDAHGAGAVVLACAGNAGISDQLEAVLGIPVVDPVRAAFRRAVSRLRNLNMRGTS